MTSTSDSRGIRAVVRLWNLGWDIGLAGFLLAVALLADRLVFHKGDWWVAVAAAAGFIGCEVGFRLGWWLMFRLLGGRARE